MKYQILYYNSLIRGWRNGAVMTQDEATTYARQYFHDIRTQGIFGEADKLYIGPYKGENVDVWPSHVWSHKLDGWQELV